MTLNDTTTESEAEDLGTVVPTSIMFDHACKVYKKMLEKAKMVPGENDGENDVVYEGHLTRLIKNEMHYSAPYYTFITQALKRMGCIVQVRRGGGNAPSVWRLVHEPTEEQFKTAEELRKPGNTGPDMVRQQMADLNARLIAVETAIGIR